MADQKRNPFAFVGNAMDSALGGIVPTSPEEIQMIAQKRQMEKEAAARILLQKQQPQVVQANPQLEAAAAQQQAAQAQQASAAAQVAQTAAPEGQPQQGGERLGMEVDENGRIVQNTVGGRVMDAIFGQWFK